jgi:hypothetical protein
VFEGLKTHTRRQHTHTKTKCSLCGKSFGNVRELNRHMITNSDKYTILFKCEECEFRCKSQETLDIHIGKSHDDEYNCGLFDLKLKNIEELETHLNTCKVYRCSVCDTKEKEISAINQHMENKHADQNSTLIDHLKISRNDKNEVTSKDFYFKF